MNIIDDTDFEPTRHMQIKKKKKKLLSQIFEIKPLQPSKNEEIPKSQKRKPNAPLTRKPKQKKAQALITTAPQPQPQLQTPRTPITTPKKQVLSTPVMPPIQSQKGQTKKQASQSVSKSTVSHLMTKVTSGLELTDQMAVNELKKQANRITPSQKGLLSLYNDFQQLSSLKFRLDTPERWTRNEKSKWTNKKHPVSKLLKQSNLPKLGTLKDVVREVKDLRTKIEEQVIKDLESTFLQDITQRGKLFLSVQPTLGIQKDEFIVTPRIISIKGKRPTNFKSDIPQSVDFIKDDNIASSFKNYSPYLKVENTNSKTMGEYKRLQSLVNDLGDRLDDLQKLRIHVTLNPSDIKPQKIKEEIITLKTDLSDIKDKIDQIGAVPVGEVFEDYKDN
jgi:hypothetical protein